MSFLKKLKLEKSNWAVACLVSVTQNTSVKNVIMNGTESRLLTRGTAKYIQTIKASVGGYFGGYYNVTIDLTNLVTTWSFNEGEKEETSKKSIRVSTGQAFIEKLKMINLLNWKAKYIATGVCDGTQWSVEILTDERTIRKYGNNQFPMEWELFCRMIRQITNRKFQ